MLRYMHIVCLITFSYDINILVCIYVDNDSWRKQRVGGNREMNLHACCMCRCWFIEKKIKTYFKEWVKERH